jgi:hypothetical protein
LPLGYSYGSFLGSPYATLRRSGLPSGASSRSAPAHRDVCPFDGDDPWMAFDELVERVRETPLPSTGERTEAVDADDLLFVTSNLLYAKQNWPPLATVLDQAEAGDGTLLRLLTDAIYGRLEDGSHDPILDRYFLLSAIEQRYPRHLDSGDSAPTAGLNRGRLLDTSHAGRTTDAAPSLEGTASAVVSSCPITRHRCLRDGRASSPA